MKLRLIVTSVAAAFVSGCKADPPVLMMRSDIGVCDQAKGAPVLNLPADGSYLLNRKPHTRSQLEKWIKTDLRAVQSSTRFVIVRFDSARGPELAWIIPAVDKAGGEVISPPPCPFELTDR